MIHEIRNIFHRLWSIPFLRFIVVGGINTVFYYVVFALFTLLQFHYIIAALFAQLCGILFNFRTIGVIVFKNRNNRLIFRFFGVYLLTYLLNIGLLKIFNMCGVGSLIAQAIVVIPLAIVTFLLMRKFVFNIIEKKGPIV